MLYTFGGKAPQVDPTAFISASAELIGDVIVGPRCYIGPYAVIRADASRIVLEEEVAVEDGVIIHTGGEDPVVTISRRVTIGHGAIIHARVIGPEASIGMGAVLSLCSEIGARAAGQDHSAGDARRGRARKAAARADRQGPHRLARDEGLVRAHGGTVSRPGQLSSGQVTA